MMQMENKIKNKNIKNKKKEQSGDMKGIMLWFKKTLT